MTISYQKSRSNSVRYYLDDSDAVVSQPIWHVKPTSESLLPALGLSRTESPLGQGVGAFRSLFESRHPVFQTPLVRNHSHPARIAVHDFTFSAPKSVSLIWGLGCDFTAMSIANAQRMAAQAGSDVLSRHFLTRRGKAGVSRVPVDTVQAFITHGASRLHDPQLHTHALTFNAGFCSDGVAAGALDVVDALAWQGAAATVYLVELAHQLSCLGYSIETHNSGLQFEVEGVPSCVSKAFSGRGAAVEAVIRTWGVRENSVPRTLLRSLALRRKAARVTRPPKRFVPLADLRHQWSQRALAMGWDVTSLKVRSADHLLWDMEWDDQNRDAMMEAARAALVQMMAMPLPISPPKVWVVVAATLMGWGTAADVERIVSILMPEFFEPLVQGRTRGRRAHSLELAPRDARHFQAHPFGMASDADIAHLLDLVPGAEEAHLPDVSTSREQLPRDRGR